MLEDLLYLLLTIAVALGADWVTFGRLGACYVDKDSSYSMSAPRIGSLLATATYSFWAIGLHQPPNELPPYFLIPGVDRIGVVVDLAYERRQAEPHARL